MHFAHTYAYNLCQVLTVNDLVSQLYKPTHKTLLQYHVRLLNIRRHCNLLNSCGCSKVSVNEPPLLFGQGARFFSVK